MKALFLSLLLLPLMGIGQTLPKVANQYAFESVVQMDNTTQQELYSRARAWFATTFNSANDVLQLESKEEGKLIGNGITVLRNGQHPTKLHFTLNLQFKDGRYRWEMSNLAYSIGQAKSTAEEMLSHKHSYNRKGELMPLPKQMVEDTHAAVARLQESLNKALQTGTTASEW
jgi:hypothetical protein